MFWFLRLLLAHLLADFPLQTNTIFRLKKRSFWGVFLHVSIFFILSIIFSVPYLKYIYSWIYLLLLSIFHIYIDWTRVKVSNKFKEQDNLLYFLFDQLEHLLSLMAIFLLPGSKEVIYWENPYLGKYWKNFYNSNYLILISIGFIIVVFAGTIINYYVRKHFNSSESFTNNGIPIKEKYLEALFKGVIFILFWLNINISIPIFVFFIKILCDLYYLKLTKKIFLINNTIDIFLLMTVLIFLKTIL